MATNCHDLSYTQQALLELVRAGLWEKDAHLLPYGKWDINEIMRLAEEQAMVGLVTAGLEHVQDVKIPQESLLQFVEQTLQLESRNKSMNKFIAVLTEKMRGKGIHTVLVKGQGITQCYKRPLWRSCGDVDLYFNKNDFVKAREYLRPFAQKIDPDNNIAEHINMVMKDSGWAVEIHANQYTELSFRLDHGLDIIHRRIFDNGEVRVWKNDQTNVYIPSPTNDVQIVFTHFLKHFYKGGLGLRQICDWCRLLWTFRGEIEIATLTTDLHSMGLLNEWRAFTALAIDYLGMPVIAMPLYDQDKKWSKKASYIMSFLLESGNFGHNRDTSYYESQWRIVRKVGSLGRKIGDLLRHARVFPLNSVLFIPSLLYNGLKSASRGE